MEYYLFIQLWVCLPWFTVTDILVILYIDLDIRLTPFPPYTSIPPPIYNVSKG